MFKLRTFIWVGVVLVLVAGGAWYAGVFGPGGGTRQAEWEAPLTEGEWLEAQPYAPFWALFPETDADLTFARHTAAQAPPDTAPMLRLGHSEAFYLRLRDSTALSRVYRAHPLYAHSRVALGDSWALIYHNGQDFFLTLLDAEQQPTDTLRLTGPGLRSILSGGIITRINLPDVPLRMEMDSRQGVKLWLYPDTVLTVREETFRLADGARIAPPQTQTLPIEWPLPTPVASRQYQLLVDAESRFSFDAAASLRIRRNIFPDEAPQAAPDSAGRLVFPYRYTVLRTVALPGGRALFPLAVADAGTGEPASVTIRLVVARNVGGKWHPTAMLEYLGRSGQFAEGEYTGTESLITCTPDGKLALQLGSVRGPTTDDTESTTTETLRLRIDAQGGVQWE